MVRMSTDLSVWSVTFINSNRTFESPSMNLKLKGLPELLFVDTVFFLSPAQSVVPFFGPFFVVQLMRPASECPASRWSSRAVRDRTLHRSAVIALAL
jgi:hypothetical protein